MSENNYGNFAEPKAPFASRRSEEVVVSALEKCELLEKELLDCLRILYRFPEYQEWCEVNYPNFVKKLNNGGEK